MNGLALNWKGLGKGALDALKRSSSLLFVLVAWEVMVRVSILDPRFFPAPTTVLVTLGKLFLSGEMLIHIGASLQRVVLGFAVGSLLGLLLGLAMGWSRAAEQILDPLIAVFYPIPKLALLPLILIIFGLGEASKVAIVAVAVFFTVVINTAAGVKMIEPVLLDAARNFGARGVRMFITVVIPATLPAIFTGLRLGLGIALVVIIAAEFVASRNGLGYMIWLAWGSLATSRMYAGLIMIGVIGLLTTNALQWLADHLMPWEGAGESRAARSSGARREEGLRPLRIFQQFGEGLFSYTRQYLYELPMDAELPVPERPANGIEFKWIDPANVDMIRPWKGSLVAHLFHRNLNRGLLGIYALTNNQVVGYVWGALKTDQSALTASHFPIEIGDGLTLAAEVHPEYRRRGIASHLRYTLIERMRELGADLNIRRVCGSVVVQNTPIQKLIERQGSVRTEEFVLVRLTPWIYLRWTWPLDGQSRRVEDAPGQFSVRFKVPEVLSDPLLLRVFGRGIVVSSSLIQAAEDPRA